MNLLNRLLIRMFSVIVFQGFKSEFDKFIDHFAFKNINIFGWIARSWSLE